LYYIKYDTVGGYKHPSMEAFHTSGHRCGSQKSKEDKDRD